MIMINLHYNASRIFGKMYKHPAIVIVYKLNYTLQTDFKSKVDGFEKSGVYEIELIDLNSFEY